MTSPATRRSISRLVVAFAIIIEVKYAHDGDLDAACKEALRQIEYTRYEDELEDDGVENILKYGIACYSPSSRTFSLKNSMICVT